MASSLSIARSCPVHVYYTCLISNTRIFCLSSRHLTRPPPRSKSILARLRSRSIILLSGRIPFFLYHILGYDYSVNYALYEYRIQERQFSKMFCKHRNILCCSFWTFVNFTVTHDIFAILLNNCSLHFRDIYAV